MKNALLRLLGPFPEPCPLECETLERVDCGSYHREKIRYAVEAGERVSAFVLIPKRISGRAPAVFCHHQHASQFDVGKSEVVGLAGDSEQAYAVELAERGYITFAPDAIAFEERNETPGSGRGEYQQLAGRIVQGKTLLAKVLHDVSVGLDYLVSRIDVDAERLGFVGHSYGGRMALWVPALDKRLKVSVSNCGCINFRDSLAPDAGIQPEFCIPGILALGDLGDVVSMGEPTSILISAAEDDVWSRGAGALFEYAKPAFAEGRLQLSMWPGGHAFNKEMRERAYQFLDEGLA